MGFIYFGYSFVHRGLYRIWTEALLEESGKVVCVLVQIVNWIEKRKKSGVFWFARLSGFYILLLQENSLDKFVIVCLMLKHESSDTLRLAFHTISTICDCIFYNYSNYRHGVIVFILEGKTGTEALLEKSGKVVCVLVYFSW